VTSYFRVCKLWVLPLKTDIGAMLKHTSWSLCWLNPIFHCELFLWFIFFAEILSFVDVGRHTRTTSLCGWPFARYQLNGLILPVMSIFFIKTFYSISIQPSIVWKHLAQTCHSITLADSRTFYQRFVFNGKTHSLQTRKYDVSMTSSVAKNI